MDQVLQLPPEKRDQARADIDRWLSIEEAELRAERAANRAASIAAAAAAWEVELG